jgi:Methane oxygenase PmoA
LAEWSDRLALQELFFMKPHSLFPFAATLLGLTFANAVAADSAVILTKLDDRVRVEINGQLFTEYIFKGASRPYCYPVNAVDGISLVRNYPMNEVPGEDTDHKHHRALMFTHSNVNRIDFWSDGAPGAKLPSGNIIHDGLLDTRSGPVGVIRSRNRWADLSGRLIATDETTLRFRGTAEARMIDYEVTIHATPEAPLVMGDNKDGIMAIRVAQWMTMPHKYLGKVQNGHGRIVTARGHRDTAAWGKRAEWCDYFAEYDGRIYGVAIFDHPQNLRHPTWWMVRDYGLFAANPFGQHDFEPEQKHPPGIGDHTIPAGGSLTLRYRFYFHFGDERTAGIAARYADYAAGR